MADTTVQLHEVNAQGNGKPVGIVVISESPYGLVFKPEMKGLSAGVHGFHVHEHPSCDPAKQNGKSVAAGAAGGHYDPEKTGKHGFPWGQGHLGDLPALYVDSGGNAVNAVLAPRMKKLSEVTGRALMVHMGGDNHADHPQPLGGGGSRIACGVIDK
jgi:Cu-Zn family superoxide dismutase